MDTLFQLLGNYVFPVVACIGMFWYMIQKDKGHHTEVDNLTQAHKEEILSLDDKHRETIALLNNTLSDNTKAIQELVRVTTILSERLEK